MFRIENFGHVLAIAFGLSAVFYYIELREVAEERIKQALKTYEDAQRTADRTFLDAAFDQIKADMNRPNWLTLAPRPKQTEQKLDDLERVKIQALFQSLQFWLVLKFLRYSHAATRILTLLSTTVSLGSLVYSGFYPDEYFGWRYITLILLVSFSSIGWYLCLYLVAVPMLIKAVIVQPSGALRADGR
jgi:hypothetical protein